MAHFEQSQRQVAGALAASRVGATLGVVDVEFENPKADAGRKAISLKQLTANRRNALKSTGPKTAAGKARSRQNAVQHGLYAVLPLLAGEDPEELRDLAEDFEQDYGHRDAATRAVAEATADLLWKSRRLRRAEIAIADEMFIASERQRLRDKHEKVSEDYDRDPATASELLAMEYAADELGNRRTNSAVMGRRLRIMFDEQLRIHGALTRSHRVLKEKEENKSRGPADGALECDRYTSDARAEQAARDRWIERRALVFSDPDVAASIIPPGFELDPSGFDWKAWEVKRDALLAAGIFPPGARLPGEPSSGGDDGAATKEASDEVAEPPPRWDLINQPSDDALLAEVAEAEQASPPPPPIWRTCCACGGQCPPSGCANENFIGPLAPNEVVINRRGNHDIEPIPTPGMVALLVMLCGWLLMVATTAAGAANPAKISAHRDLSLEPNRQVSLISGEPTHLQASRPPAGVEPMGPPAFCDTAFPSRGRGTPRRRSIL